MNPSQNNRQYTEHQQPEGLWDTPVFQEMMEGLMTPQGAALAALIGVGAAMSMMSDKSSLTTGGLGDASVLAGARKIGLCNISSPKMRNRSMWIGDIKDPKALWLPHILPGVMLVGAPGTGKSFGGFEPMLYSAILQRYGILLYDYKYPDQTSRIAAFANSLGYKVRVVAPGRPETACLNLIELLSDETTTLEAAEVIELAKKNLGMSAGKDSSSQYFDNASTKVLTGMMCLVRKCIFPDLLMIQALLLLDNLPARIYYNQDKMAASVYASLGDLITAADSEDQLAGVKASCSQLIDKMADLNFASALCGKSTVPLDIQPGELVILGLDRRYQKVIAPILAVLANTLINRNLLKKRSSPLVFSCDELSTVYLPGVVDWLSQGRSYGFLGLFGIQSPFQLVETYGKNYAEIIYTGCGTKFFFNPNNVSVAADIAKWSGLIDQQYKSKNKSFGRNNRSRSYNENHRFTLALQDTDITRFDLGECLIINQGFKQNRQAYVPIRHTIHLPKHIEDHLDLSEELWSSEIEPKLIKSNTLSKTFTDKDLKERIEYAKHWLPLPPPEPPKKKTKKAAKT